MNDDYDYAIRIKAMVYDGSDSVDVDLSQMNGIVPEFICDFTEEDPPVWDDGGWPSYGMNEVCIENDGDFFLELKCIGMYRWAELRIQYLYIYEV